MGLLPGLPPCTVHTQTARSASPSPCLCPAFPPAPSGPCIWSCAGRSSPLPPLGGVSACFPPGAQVCSPQIARVPGNQGPATGTISAAGFNPIRSAETSWVRLVVSSSLMSCLHLWLPSRIGGVMGTWVSPISNCSGPSLPRSALLLLPPLVAPPLHR